MTNLHCNHNHNKHTNSINDSHKTNYSNNNDNNDLSQKQVNNNITLQILSHSISTPALEFLNRHNAIYSIREYEYIPKGGSTASSLALGKSHHWIIKTLIFTNKLHNDNNSTNKICVLMHGDYNVDEKLLAIALNIPYSKNKKPISMSDETDAQQSTGYLVGGTSPFALRTSIPIYIESSIVHGHSSATDDNGNRVVNDDSDIYVPGTVCINGGSRGLLVEMKSLDIYNLLNKPPLINVGKLMKKKKVIPSSSSSSLSSAPSASPSPTPSPIT